MGIRRSLFVCLAVLGLFAGHAMAEEDDGPPGVNSVNLNPLGALFGSYSVNYERLFDKQHGLLVEGYFSSSSDDNSSASAAGGLLGYRWHWSQSQNSGFLGANVGFGSGTGEGTVNGEKFEVSLTQVDLTLNAGRRWAWKSGFNVTFRLGVGRAFRTFEAESSLPEAEQAAKDVEDFLNAIPVTFDGELSIGWVF